jgi:hypothetical protein
MKHWWPLVLWFCWIAFLVGFWIGLDRSSRVQAQAQPASGASRNVDLEDCSAILFTHADASVTVSIQLNKSDVRIEHPGIAVCVK